MKPCSPLEGKIREAIADPGRFTTRRDNSEEPISHWSARAVVSVLSVWLESDEPVDLVADYVAYDDELSDSPTDCVGIVRHAFAAMAWEIANPDLSKAVP